MQGIVNVYTAQAFAAGLLVSFWAGHYASREVVDCSQRACVATFTSYVNDPKHSKPADRAQAFSLLLADSSPLLCQLPAWPATRGYQIRW